MQGKVNVMKFRILLIIGLHTALIACGTVKTVFQQDTTTARDLQEVGTRCDVIPRFYSGTAYNFCFMTGKPGNEASWRHIKIGFGDMALDFLFSGALDTMILPYGIYQQVQHGSIEIR